MERISWPFALGLSLLCCSSGPPIKTASGEVIESVTYEERSPKSTDTREVKLSGDRLRTAVALMDRSEVTGMSGDYQSTERGDKDSLVITIVGAENRQRKIVVTNCAEVHVCGFFAAAVKSEIVDKVPAVCRDGLRCAN